MTGTIRWHEFDASDASFKRAQVNFANLVAHVANLYCMGEASSVSSCEAQELAMSTIYVLGIADASPEEAARVLDVDDPIQLWRDAISTLESRVDDALAVWREVCPDYRGLHVSLYDLLAPYEHELEMLQTN